MSVLAEPAPRAIPTRRRARVLALIFAGLAPAVLAAQVLPLEEALRLGEERSRLLTAQESAALASREMAVAARQLPDPTLRVGVDNVPAEGSQRFSLTSDFMTMRSVGVMQQLTRRDKRDARSERFQREAEAAEAARELALTNVRRDTATAWLERHYYERMREVLASQRAEATLQVEAAESAYRGGGGGQADVFAARSAVATVDERILQVDRQVANATTRLERWVGSAARRPLGPAPDFATEPLDSSRVEAQPEHHPEVALLARREAVARAAADVARAEKHADWSVELMYGVRGSRFTDMVSLNFSIPLQWDQPKRQDRELAARLALAEQARAEREDATLTHIAELRTWLQEWRSDVERVRHYDATLVPLAAERTRAALAAYRGGGGSLGSVLEARRMEIDVRLERLRVEMEAALVRARLEHLVLPAHLAAARPAPSTETKR